MSSAPDPSARPERTGAEGGRNGDTPAESEVDPIGNGTVPSDGAAPPTPHAGDASRPTCAAVTASGRPCRNPAASPQPYCTLHAQILLEQLDAGGGLAVAGTELARPEAPAEHGASPVRVVDAPTLVVRRSAPWTLRAVAVAAVLVVGLAIVGAVAGYAVAGLGTEVRAARAEVTYLLDDSLPTGFLREDRRLSTQIVTIESRSLLEPIAAAHGLDVDDLMGDVNATVLDDSEVIRIEVQDTDGDRALAITDELVVAYAEHLRVGAGEPDSDVAGDELTGVTDELVDVLVRLRELDQTPDDADAYARQLVLIERRDEIADRVDDPDVGATERRTLELEERAVEDELVDTLAAIDVDLGDAPDAAAVAERDALARRVTDLLGERAELLARTGDVVDSEPLSVLTPPYLLDDPVSPRPMRSALAGGLLGLVVGLLAILVQRQLQTRGR